MKEQPILFSGPMVRAILEGRKTQTRRVAKIKPAYATDTIRPDGKGWLVEHWPKCEREMQNFGRVDTVECPYGQRGDRLWVRETFAPHDTQALREKDVSHIYYRADDGAIHESDGPWKPSIFMPRWASRITLEITAVRAQRVQDIDYKDCEAEGLFHAARAVWSCPGTDEIFTEGYRGYKWLWDSINAERGFGWYKNPWVWAITFKRL